MAEPKHTIEIPEYYLLTIAVHGNMGDGELPDMMKAWAQKECDRLGLAQKLRELQIEKLKDLDQRLRNVLGNEPVDRINSMIGEAARRLGKAGTL